MEKDESFNEVLNESSPDVELLLIEARNSISKYCYTECNAYCCRKGYLLLTNNEANIVAGEKRKDLEEKEILTEIKEGEYVLDFNANGGCPALNNYKCTIHKNPERPKTCAEFPLFLWSNKTIRLSPRCPAVRENLFYPYVAKLKLMGFKISEE